MIVRINQLTSDAAELSTGWDAGNLRGPVERPWPEDTFAYQLLVLDRNEEHEPVSNSARREHLRQMLPNVIDALAGPDDRTVLRLDGPFSSDGVAPAFVFAADPDRCERFSYSAADHLADRAELPITSIRIFPRSEFLTEMCTDSRIALHRAVRLRVYGLPEDLVDPMLDTADLDDERWRDLLPRVAFCVSTADDLLSLLIWSRDYDPSEVRRRITNRLGGHEKENGQPGAAQRS